MFTNPKVFIDNLEWYPDNSTCTSMLTINPSPPYRIVKTDSTDGATVYVPDTQTENSEVEKTKQPPEVFCKKAIPKNFAIFTGKDLCWSCYIIYY